MSMPVSDIAKLSAAKIDAIPGCSANLRTPWTSGLFIKAGKDNGVFVEIRSKNYEKCNLSKTGY